jgi:hypothetical protein
VHHVGAERFLPGLGRIANRQRADIADDGVDAAEFGGGAINPALQRVRVGDIDRPAPRFDTFRRQALHDVTDLVGIARADRDVGALGRKQLGDRQPNALAAASHERALSL